MQTFMPYPNFEQTMRCLDYRRLGKQRVEAKQIIMALEGAGGWAKHPATLMWSGFIPALANYGHEACSEWIARGYVDNLRLFFVSRCSTRPTLPPWLGNPEFHASHRSNLLRKDPVHYSSFNWTEPHDLPYIWPRK